MSNFNKRFINEWFSLSENELIDVLYNDYSTKDQIHNALYTLDEKYNYSEREILNLSESILGNVGKSIAGSYIASKAVEKAQQGLKAAKKIPGELKTKGTEKTLSALTAVKNAPGKMARSAVQGTKYGLKNAWQNIKNQMNPFHAQGKFMSLDDLFKEPSELARERSNKASLADMRSRQDELEKKSNQPLKTNKTTQEEFGALQMKKTFNNLMLELADEYNSNLLEVFTNDVLVDIILDEDFDQTLVDAAIIELFNRGELNEQDLMELNGVAGEPPLIQAPKALPAPKTTSVAVKSNSLPATKTTAVGRPIPTQKALPSGEKVVGGKTIRPSVPSVTGPSVASAPKTTLGAVGKSALGAAGRLASRYSPHATALTTGYEVGKQLNKISAVDRVTDKIGKGIASGLQKIGIGTAPEVVRAKSPEVSRKAPDTGAKTTVPAKNGGGVVTFPKSATSAPAKPAAPKPMAQKSAAPMKPMAQKAAAPKPMAQKALPKPAAKPAAPKGPEISPELAASITKMRSAISDMASKTGATKGSLQKLAPAGRSERRITPGGQTSSQVHSAIAKLGGEPTRSIPKAAPAPKAIPKAAVSGGAPTTAIGSEPPPLVRSTAKKM